VPSQKLFDIAKRLVNEVNKAKTIEINTQFKSVMIESKINDYQGDCFYFSPGITKTSTDLILNS